MKAILFFVMIGSSFSAGLLNTAARAEDDNSATQVKSFKAVGPKQEQGSGKLPDGWGAGVSLAIDGMAMGSNALHIALPGGPFFYISLSSGNPLQYTLGGIYKMSIHEDSNIGLHWGLGAMAGYVTAGFYVNAVGLAGIHFHFIDLPKLVFSLEGGPVFHIGAAATGLTVGFLGVNATYYW